MLCPQASSDEMPRCPRKTTHSGIGYRFQRSLCSWACADICILIWRKIFLAGPVLLKKKLIRRKKYLFHKVFLVERKQNFSLLLLLGSIFEGIVVLGQSTAWQCIEVVSSLSAAHSEIRDRKHNDLIPRHDRVAGAHSPSYILSYIIRISPLIEISGTNLRLQPDDTIRSNRETQTKKKKDVTPVSLMKKQTTMTKAGIPTKKIPSSKEDPPKKRRKERTFRAPPAASASLVHMASQPSNSRVIQTVRTPHTVSNHSYVDYSLVPPGHEDNTRPKQIQDMDFHQMLHSMLSRDDLAHSIRWLSHGRAFRIDIPTSFEKIVCPEYFGHKRYSSFLYQLGAHGYKTISTGIDKGAFYSSVGLHRCTSNVRIGSDYFVFHFCTAAFTERLTTCKAYDSCLRLPSIPYFLTLSPTLRPVNKVYAKPERVSASCSRPWQWARFLLD